MIPEYFAYIGAILVAMGGLYYIYEIFRGIVATNRVTWLLWGILAMIVFAAQRAQGVDALSWTTLAMAVTSFLIVLASYLDKDAYWKTERHDYYLAGAAIFGIILWALTDNPNLAIAFSLLADLFAGLPTLIKTYKHPETESWRSYVIYTVGYGITLLAIQTISFENFAFVFYLFILNGLLAFFASRRKLT